jgi:hypothetical protein
MDGQRMSSTQVEFQLDPADTPKQTKTKIAKSFCEPGNLNKNIAIQLARDLIFPLADFKRECFELSHFSILRF